MTTVSIGEFCDLHYGRALREDKRVHGKIPVFGSNGIVGFHHEGIVQSETIIIGRKGSIGEAHYVDGPSWPIDTTYYVSIKPEYEVNLRWFYRILKTLRLSELNRSAAVPGLNRNDVYKIRISLPPLEDQVRIANLLRKVEGLVDQRKQHLEQLDDLIKSVFASMFGECIRNEDDYDEITKACDFIDYRGKTPPRVESGVPLISAKCVRQGYFDDRRIDYITEDTYRRIMTRGFPKAGDVLFTTEGATFGYTCRIPKRFEKFAVGQRLITLSCKEGYQPTVLDYTLNHAHLQKKLANRKSGSAALGIRSAELAKIRIPFPSKILQERFASIIDKTEPIVASMQESLAALSDLYSALSQMAFKGELDLSRVPLDTIVKTDKTREGRENTQQSEPTSTGSALAALDRDAMTTMDGRVNLLKQWFAEWVRDPTHSGTSSMMQFWQTVRLRAVDYRSEEDEMRDFSPTEYDQLKQWIFDEIEQGRIKQIMDKRIVPGDEFDSGNEIALRAAR